MEKEDYLPLFFYVNDPIGVFIVDNELVHLESIKILRNTGQYAFYLLEKLSKNELIGKKLPKKFVEKQSEYFVPHKVPWPCLTGILFERNYCKCLSAKVTVKKVKSQPFVYFNEFALMNGHAVNFKVNNIPGEVFFEPIEAFILLANQVATSHSHLLFDGYNEEYKEHYREHLRENIINYYKRKRAGDFSKNYIFRANMYYTAFNLDYFEYLEKQILEGEITPFEILKLNGPAVVNYLSAFMLEPDIITEFIEHTASELVDNYDLLSANNKIMYIILHLIDGYYYKSKSFQQYKKAITKKIFRDYSLPFPSRPVGDNENIFDVWERYDLPEPKFPNQTK